MERLTTEFANAGIDRQQQNSAIFEREDATVPFSPARKGQQQSARTSRRFVELPLPTLVLRKPG
ncbi:MAG TPA: hypothetical protein VGE93_01990 [Bryobacteraceae bacterium]